MDYAEQADLVLKGIAMDEFYESLATLTEAFPKHTPGPRKAHCYGLPRTYPKMWMGRPESNSRKFEVAEFGSLSPEYQGLTTRRANAKRREMGL